MMYQAKLKFAKQCDKMDPLRKFRKQFYLPEDEKNDPVYLCGNSLGLLSKKVRPAINQELRDWKNKAIAGYMQARNPWMYYQHQFKKPLSKIVGCLEDEVTVMNALTV